ncbi:MAG: hypothetical protein ACJA1Z_000496 [Patiriisocius sp.]
MIFSNSSFSQILELGKLSICRHFNCLLVRENRIVIALTFKVAIDGVAINYEKIIKAPDNKYGY